MHDRPEDLHLRSLRGHAAARSEVQGRVAHGVEVEAGKAGTEERPDRTDVPSLDRPVQRRVHHPALRSVRRSPALIPRRLKALPICVSSTCREDDFNTLRVSTHRCVVQGSQVFRICCRHISTLDEKRGIHETNL